MSFEMTDCVFINSAESYQDENMLEATFSWGKKPNLVLHQSYKNNIHETGKKEILNWVKMRSWFK